MPLVLEMRVHPHRRNLEWLTAKPFSGCDTAPRLVAEGKSIRCMWDNKSHKSVEGY
jgi:hypothetical protein